MLKSDKPYEPVDNDQGTYFRAVDGTHMRASQRRDGDLCCGPAADVDRKHNHWYDWDAHSAIFSTLSGGGGASPHTRTALAYLTHGKGQFTQDGIDQLDMWERLSQGRDLTVTRRPENTPSFLRVRATDELVTVEFLPQVKYASAAKAGLKHGQADETCAIKMEFTAASVGNAQKFRALRLLPIAMLQDYGRRPAHSTVTAVYPRHVSWNSCVQDVGNYKAGRSDIAAVPYTL